MQVAHVQLSPDRIRAVQQGACSRLLIPAAPKYGDMTIAQVMSLTPAERAKFCPRGQVGDILWVQEDWMCVAPDSGDWQWRVYSKLPAPGNVDVVPPAYRSPEYCLYSATYREGSRPGYPIRWAPAVSMPRWASRLYLKIMSIDLVTLDAMTPAVTDETGITLEAGDKDSLAAFKRTLHSAYGDRFLAPDQAFWSIRFARLDQYYVAQALEAYPSGVPDSPAAKRHAEIVEQTLKTLDVAPSTYSVNESFAGMRAKDTNSPAGSVSRSRVPMKGRSGYSSTPDRYDRVGSAPTSKAYGGYRDRT